MIQKITDGIIAVLLEAFPDITVYAEQVKQGLVDPCFIVRCLTPRNEKFLGNRYYRENLFTVQYIPESDTDAQAECYAVNEILWQILEYIKVDGDLLRGTGMRSEYNDGILTVMVNYNMFVYVVAVPGSDGIELMEILDLHIHVKNNEGG